MATIYLSNVNHKLYENVYFKNLSDDEKDKIYFKVYGTNDAENYKQFIIEEPRIRLQLTDYLFNLIKDEMFYDIYHNIQYKQVDNKEFYKRLKKYPTQKFRFYYQDRWITFYFNLVSKHKVMESDFPVALTIYASFPAKGLNNFLLPPCTIEGSLFGEVKCWTSDWRVCAFIEGLSKEEDFCRMKGKICYDPPYRLKFENYFYTLPGKNDYILEAYTIDYDKGMYRDKCTEYYILDREGDYFKKATSKIEDFKDLVLRKFNKNPERIDLFCPKNGDRVIVAYKVNDKFDTFEDMFKYLGRSWIGRHNAFIFQWNKYMEYFNGSKDGFYCPPQGLFNLGSSGSSQNFSPPIIPTTDVLFLNQKSDTLLQETIPDYTPKKWEITKLEDIKILTMVEYLKFNIAVDKWLELLDINADTIADFDKYAVIHYQILDAY